MRAEMDQPFTSEEVLVALLQMNPTKVPGPDGFPTAFYQKHWLSVQHGVIKTCLQILNGQGDVTQLNHTYIVLIPKVKNPKKMSEFRPISLFNVIYRVILKIIANR